MASGERLGASFDIDITNLKAGLTQANRLIRESESRFREAASGMDNWSKSEDGLKKRQSALNDQIDIQKKKIKALVDEKQKIIDKMKKEGKSQEDIEKAIDKTNKQITNESKQLDKLKGELDKTDAALDELTESNKKAGNSAEESSGGFTVMKGALADLVANGFRIAIDAAKDFVKSMIEVGTSFDTAMAQVSAVSGATGEDLEMIRDKAKEMGETTKFTASEAADAFNYMAMAGWKTEEMLGGIDGILNLAAASGSDLATTSDIVTDALTAMGYKASDAGRLADVMAAASSNANTNVEMMGATFQYAAPLVGALGYTMEDTAVAIGLMANAGIKGEKAGTALRSVFTRLASPPKAAAESMNQLGLSLTDSQGKMKPFNEVVQDLRKSFAGLDETEQAHHASAIAGQEAMSGLLAIVNAAPSDFDKLTSAVANSEGAAQSMADTMIDNLGGDMTILQSQLDGVRLTLYEEFEPTLRTAIKSVQKWISKIDWKSFGKKAKDALTTIISKGKELGSKVLPIIKTIAKATGKAIGFLIDNFETLAPIVFTAVTAFKAFKAVMAVTTAITAAKKAITGLSAGVGIVTKAQAGWNAVMAANPIGAVITAVGLLAGGIALLVGSTDDASDSQDVLNESQREAVNAASEAAEAYQETKTAADELAGAELANITHTQNLWKELQTLADENGKVKEGYEGRAQYILNELNNALGTEYSMNGNIIQSYKDISASIDDVIEKKKAQILLEAYEDSYREAVEKVSKAEMARATNAQGLSKAQEELKEKTEALEAAQKAYEESLTKSDSRYEMSAQNRLREAEAAVENAKANLDEQQAAYDQSEAGLYQYYKDISDYQTASTLVIEGETGKAIELLNNLGSGFKTAASTADLGAKEQKKVLEQQVIDTEVNAQLMEQAYKDGVAGVTEQMVKTAREQADNAKEEFLAVGGNITKGIAEGAEGEENTKWTLSGAMSRLIKKAVAAAQKAADSHSPSRLFRDKIGKMLGAGIAVGVDESTKGIVKSVKKQVNDIREAYDLGDISASVGTGFGNRSSGQSASSSVGGVVVNQTNVYSQAHSRYELYKSKQQTAAAVRLAMGV